MTPNEQLDEYIKSHRLRRTFEREEVLRLIIQLDSHFTRQSLYDEYQRQGNHLAQASFYNIIDFFLQASIIVKHPFAGIEQQYELRQRADSHHHKICTECGTIKEFSDQKITKAIAARHFNAFDTQYQTVYLYGLCSKCRRLKEKNKNR